MKNHYYSETPGAQSKRETWEFELKGINFDSPQMLGFFRKKKLILVAVL